MSLSIHHIQRVKLFPSLLRRSIINSIIRLSRNRSLLFLAASVLITGLAFAIRLYHLGSDGFWIDEILTAKDIRGGLPGMLTVRSHPPLLYLLGNLSVIRFGESEFALRLPSLYAGLLAIPLMIGLGQAMRRPGAGLLAALLLALSPFHLHHSQEARHYALLMTFSLASYLLLYRAWRRPKWRWWLGYALATTLNLYSHYAAFLVLAAQSVLIAAWSLIQLGRRRLRLLLYPAGAALTVISLYAIRLPQVQRALQHNIGPEAGTGTFNQPTPLYLWIQSLYVAFGAYLPFWKPAMLLFVLLGLLVFLWQREWRNLAFVGVGLVAPLLLIVATQIDRSAFARYIIYLLPLYLFLAAVGLAALPRAAQQRWGNSAGLFAGCLIVGALLVFGRAPVQREHEIVNNNDWRGLMIAVADQAQPGDVVLPLMLSFNSEWNPAEIAANYYGSIFAPDVTILPAYRLGPDESAMLAGQDGDVWVVMTYWEGEVPLVDPNLALTEFSYAIYLLHDPQLAGSTKEKVTHYYELLLPLANEELPACLLRQDLAALAMQDGDYLRAAGLLGEPSAECPLPANSDQAIVRHDLLERLYPALQAELAALQEQGDSPGSGRVAEMILRLYPQDDTALSVLEIADLLEWFEAGRAQVDSAAPEPVRRETFWMPYGQPDDEGDVIFAHAPSRVSYTISLPPESALLRFRVGMASHSWDWGGDGSTFIVRVMTENGDTVDLFQRYVSNDVDDRYWHPAKLSLAEFAGQTITLTLETTPGPAGDTTGDWALWDSPRIVPDLEDGK